MADPAVVSYPMIVLDPNDLSPPSREAEAIILASVPALARHPHLLEDVLLLSKNAGLEKAPLVMLYSTLGMYSSTVKFPAGYEIVIGEGHLEKLNRQELNGVIAHELAHIALGHIKEPTLWSKVSNYWLRKDLLIGPLLSWQRREEVKEADKKGAIIAGDAEGLMNAFEKMQNEKEKMQKTGLSGILQRIENRLNVIFKPARNTRPSLPKRIEELEEFSASHHEELEASKSNLDALSEKMRGDFAQAAPLSTAKTGAPAHNAPARGLSSSPA